MQLWLRAKGVRSLSTPSKPSVQVVERTGHTLSNTESGLAEAGSWFDTISSQGSGMKEAAATPNLALVISPVTPANLASVCPGPGAGCQAGRVLILAN